MAWTSTDLARSYPCNMRFLKQCRENRNWTQKQLAQRAGYTERLIRKAESGRNISVGTIDDLATALSTTEQQIFPEDMITCYESLARSFTDAWYCQQKNMAMAIKHIVHPETAFRIHGDQDSIPFAGHFQGLAEFTHAIKQFFGMMEVPRGHDHKPHYRYFTRGRSVAVWGASWIQPIGYPLTSPIPITQRFRFERGKLISFEDFCSQQRIVGPIYSARVKSSATELSAVGESETDNSPSFSR